MVVILQPILLTAFITKIYSESYSQLSFWKFEYIAMNFTNFVCEIYNEIYFINITVTGTISTIQAQFCITKLAQ